MNIFIGWAIFINTIHYCLVLPVVGENVFSLTNISETDPYEDYYIQTIFHMEHKQLMQLPKLDDETFLLELQRNVDDLTGLIVVKNSSVFDDRKDEILLSESSIEEKWEDLVIAGPIAVNYISNLMVIASRKDFVLIPPTPDYIYEYIKHPNSFRATLVQVVNEMYSAFLSAHSNMDRIQLNMQQIPNQIKTALKLLTTASPRLIKSLLPLTLNNIERIANQCVQSANSTILAYSNLSAFLRELTEITTGTQASNELELEAIDQLLSNSTAEHDLLNSQLELIRKEFEAAREALQKAQKEYYDAFHAIPGRKKRFFGSVFKPISTIVSSVSNVVGGALNTVGCIFTSCSGGGGGGPPNNSAFEYAKQKAELALQRLKEAQVLYDKWYSQMLEKQNKLTNTIIQLSQLNFSTVNHETIIKILISATKEIVHLQQQWDKMIRFFTKLSIQAENTQETILYEFLAVIEATEVINGVLDDADREFYVTLLLQTADEIDRGAHLLYIMSKTYHDISHQYIMNQIAGVTALIVTETNDQRENHLKQIAQETLSTSSKISRLVLEKQQHYEQRNRERQIIYQEFLQELISEELQSSIGK